MGKTLTAIMCLFLIGGIFVAPALAGSQDFVLDNQTGFDIYGLYIAPYTSDDWEEDVLGGDVLIDGDVLEINFDYREETYWDLMIKDEKGNSYTWRKFNLKEISRITLYYDGNESWAEYE